MRSSSRQGGLRVAVGFGLAALIAFALLLAPAGGGAAPSATAQKKCSKALVDGRNTCLRIGDKCKKKLQADYVRSGYACKKSRLRKASIKQLRGPEPVLIDKQGRVSVDSALAAFDTGIADMPGVKPQPGEIGKLGDPTFVLAALQAQQTKLSKQQRKVLDAVTTPAPDALTIPVDDAAAARIDPRVESRSRPRADRRAGDGVTVGGGTVDEQIIALEHIRNARKVMRSHGYALLRPISVSFLETDKIVKGKKVYAYVPYGDLPPGASPSCNIFVTKFGRAAGAGVQELVYAHELAHCAQHDFFTSQAQAAKAPAWVIEGGADWLGGMTVQELGDTVEEVEWDPWLKLPEFDLFGRSYSGVGFFAMIHQAKIDGWQRMREVLSASSGGSPAAYAKATAGLPDVFWQRWGPGLARDPSQGTEWDYEGPGIPKTTPEELTIGSGTRRVSTIQARSSHGGKLKVNTDVLVILADKDLRGELRTNGNTRKLAKGAYCAKAGGCKCKSNTNLQLPQVGSTAFFGFGDGFKKRTVVFEGVKLKDYCKKPRPGPGEGPGTGPGTNPPGTCPTTPAARAPARADGETCPAPAPGIDIYTGDSETLVLVASFKIGDCTEGAGGFTAISSDGAWRLEVGISNFSGFGDYEIPYGGPDPLVIIDGPLGTFSNETWAPPGLPFAGAISFSNGDKHGMGLGFIEFRTADESAAITGAGGMTCVYPDD